ncbi:MAG: tRNA pseudouridine(55) synthase TruB [Actinomycetota bacterium]
MDGLLVVDKPSGLTSHDVVSIIRRLTNEKRVGHTGTLDPAATGVLLVLVGRATKISYWLTDEDKTYEGTIALGAETETLDGEGSVVATADASQLTRRDVEDAAEILKGRHRQEPPAFSAVKIEGRPAYRSARQGTVVQPPARSVEVSEFLVLDFRQGELAEADVRISCSKGTYIRSLARDLGQRLGCGGYLKKLRRTAVGPFTLARAIALKEFERALTAGEIADRLISMSEALRNMPQTTVAEAYKDLALTGGVLCSEAVSGSQQFAMGTRAIAVVDDNDNLIGLYEPLTGDRLKPLRVIGEGRA